MSEIGFKSPKYQRFYRRLDPLFKDSEKQAYVMVVLSLLTIAFFSFFAIRPTLKTIAVLEKKIEDKNELNRQLDQKIQSLIGAQEEYQKYQRQITILYNLLPPQPEFPPLVNQLEIIAQTHQTTITSLSFEPIELYSSNLNSTPDIEADNPTSDIAPEVSITSPQETASQNTKLVPLNFSISYQGSYANLVNLLSDLTRQNRLITLHSVSLTETSSETSTSTLTVSLYSKAYYYPM